MQSELKRSDSPQVQRSGDSGSREAGIRVIGQHSVTTPAAHKKGLLKEQLELERVKTKDGRVRYTIKSIEEQLAFDKGFYVFVRALQMLKSQNDGVIMVGLGGPSGSGKTAFSTKVFNFMPGVEVISMDMYNDGSKVVDENFDDPRLTDYDTLLANLADLRAGLSTEIPIYDFKTSRRVGTRTMSPPPSRIIILEGIYALSDRLRPLEDLRVSVTGGVHFDLVKRVMRDIERTGFSPEEIVQQITTTVFPMYKAFIEPTVKTAQIKIHNSFNPFSGFMNATYTLKSTATREAATVLAALGEDATQSKEVDISDIYLLPPNEDPETCVSWLRMRNRDGRYSLMFEEWVTEGDFIISPRVSFEVNVRILGGLMALGYQIGNIMRRTSSVFHSVSRELTVKMDEVENLGRFLQVLGKDRARVANLGEVLGLQGTYIARSYIEQVQLEKLTTEFQMTEEFKRNFSLCGDLIDELMAASPDYRKSLDERVGASAEGGHDDTNGSNSAHPRLLRRSSSLGQLGQPDSDNSAGGTEPSVASTAPANGNGVVRNGSGAPPRPGLHQQLLRVNSALRLSESGSQVGSDAAPAGGSSASLAALPPTGTSVGLLQRVSDRLEQLGKQLDRHESLQLQLDAMVVQYRDTSEHLESLSAANARLASTVERLEGHLGGAATAGPVAAAPGGTGLAGQGVQGLPGLGVGAGFWYGLGWAGAMALPCCLALAVGTYYGSSKRALR